MTSRNLKKLARERQAATSASYTAALRYVERIEARRYLRRLCDLGVFGSECNVEKVDLSVVQDYLHNSPPPVKNFARRFRLFF